MKFSEYQFSREARRTMRRFTQLGCPDLVFDPHKERTLAHQLGKAADEWANKLQAARAALPIIPFPSKLRRYEAAIESVRSCEKGLGSALLLATQATMLLGDGTDYFIETPELADLIAASVREFTGDVLDVMVEGRRTAFVINPPSPRPSVLVGVHNVHGASFAIFSERTWLDGGNLLLPSAFHTKRMLTSDHWGTRLAIGLALYARAFPHAITDGVPSIPARSSASGDCRRRVHVGVAPELKRNSPSGHIRGFHWRFLTSPKFTHKQYQQVFVRTAKVRGKCKIVMEVEQ